MITFYQQIITDVLEKQAKRGVDPRHVEAWMRVEHHTLDALANWQWEKEVALACDCIKAAGIADSENLAQSYGLFKREPAQRDLVGEQLYRQREYGDPRPVSSK